MELAVNYSVAAANLLRRGAIQIDRFKCPAWPDLIVNVQQVQPVYVHFSLRVGRGIGDAVDTETNQPADWGKVKALLAQTDTPLINVHLAPTVEDYPDIPADTTASAHVETLVEHMIRDVRGVVERFGPECVIVENDHDFGGRNLRPAFLPKVIRRVIEETGCGLLLDLAHARLAANYLGVDVHEYVNALPTAHIREIHVSGVQCLDGHWAERVRLVEGGVDAIQHLFGRPVDHLPMTEQDWGFATWVMERVRSGAWGQPWVVTFEYGGISSMYKAVTEMDVLEEQVPRLYALVRDRNGR